MDFDPWTEEKSNDSFYETVKAQMEKDHKTIATRGYLVHLFSYMLADSENKLKNARDVFTAEKAYVPSSLKDGFNELIGEAERLVVEAKLCDPNDPNHRDKLLIALKDMSDALDERILPPLSPDEISQLKTEYNSEINRGAYDGDFSQYVVRAEISKQFNDQSILVLALTPHEARLVNPDEGYSDDLKDRLPSPNRVSIETLEKDQDESFQ